MQTTDPLPLAQALIRCPSVTPVDAGALDVLSEALSRLGFTLHRRKFEDVENLYALRRTGPGRTLCFAGQAFLQATPEPNGAIAFLITADEEGPAIHGTKRMLEELAAMGERIDHCLVGEPTSSERFGDTIKNGRRGSLNAVVTATGKQGHVAYPEKSANPVPALMAFCQALLARRLDEGAPGFTPSNLEVTTIDVGNAAHNVIPAKATAKFNIRFNTAHQGEDLLAWIEENRARTEAQFPGVSIGIAPVIGARPFYTQPSGFTALIQEAAQAETGGPAILSTTGGTSDARFIKDVCPVAEFGLLNDTAHKVDEHVAVEDVRALARVYARVCAGYF
jgi:succinyl-diaminopimelate desuccinylase